MRAEEMQKYENMVKTNDLARVADILEKGFVNRLLGIMDLAKVP